MSFMLMWLRPCSLQFYTLTIAGRQVYMHVLEQEIVCFRRTSDEGITDDHPTTTKT